MLSIHNYKKTYGTVTVLSIEQLQLTPGFYWLQGENGAGKTTLLKSIAGLVPFEGSIEVQGISLRRQRRPYTKVVSFAAAEPVYPAFLTGKEVLQFYLQTKGGTIADSRPFAETLGIAPFLSGKVGTYSSGMLKKLSLLVCFTGQPTVLLLDEPFVTLDNNAVAALRDLLVLLYDRGVSFLISSHQAPEIAIPCQDLYIRQQTIQQNVHVAGTV
jgi:ABC-2 type transport system ATP-binding protein